MRRAILLATLSVGLCSWQLPAGILTIATTRAGLGGNDFIDWSQLGPDFTTVTSPLNVTSNGGLGPDHVVNGTQAFFSIQQGNTWGGNFAPNAAVLYNQAGGPFTITFASPISGAGLQFQSATLGSFTAIITVFGAGNVNFGTVTRSGTSTNNGDNSAIFLGALSSLNDIVSLQFNVTILSGGNQINDPNGFGVNRLDLVAGPTSVPEPTTVVLFSAGVGLITFLRRR